MAPVDIPAGLDDPRLEDYRHIGDPAWLLARGCFVAEGRLVVERLVADRRHPVRSLLLTEAAARALAHTVAQVAPETAVYVTPQAAMNAVVGFNIHRGCLALASRPPAAVLDSLPLDTATAVVVAEGVNNPDNVGGLFRNAAALGAAALVLGPDCGDPFYRKAIRTSMAATLRLPWASAGAWPDALDALRRAGLAIVAATPGPGAVSLYDAGLPARAAVLVGAEGPGLSPAAIAKADLCVRIPMHADMDSLNVATAAAVILAALAARRA
ncbi:MAG: TrmH family RNA methyltransferase [Vicinamibacterales bacterium]